MTQKKNRPGKEKDRWWAFGKVRLIGCLHSTVLSSETSGDSSCNPSFVVWSLDQVMNPEPEPADLSLSPLYIQPCNYSARDGQGNSYFVTETSVGKDDSQPMFESISRKSRSRFMLLGIGVATIKNKNLLVYEDGSPWESTSVEDLRYRTREFLCSLHHLHYDLKACHQRINYKAKNSLVVSKSSIGKLTGMTGCKDCSKNAEKERLCHYQARYKDLCDVVDYINLYMHAYLDLEFKTFLNDKDHLMKLISHPPEVIYQHPVWIAHPINKLFSRSVLNGHFKRFMNNFGNNGRLRTKIYAYYQANRTDSPSGDHSSGRDTTSTIFLLIVLFLTLRQII